MNIIITKGNMRSSIAFELLSINILKTKATVIPAKAMSKKLSKRR